MKRSDNWPVSYSQSWTGTRTGARFSKVPKAFRARKAIRKTPACLFCKAGLFICRKGNKNKNNCKVSCLNTPSFWRYIDNYVTRNAPEKFRDFRETGPWRELLKLRPAYSVKLVFSYVVKGIKIKITAKFHASRPLRCKDTKRIVIRNPPEKFRDFRETGPRPIFLVRLWYCPSGQLA